MDHDHEQNVVSQDSRWKWVLIVFLAIAAFFLITEHRAHLFGVLPYLLLLACPFMHMFGHGHGGHGGHGDKDIEPDRQDANKSAETPGHQHH